MDIKLLSIDKIGLSNRSSNALHRAKIHTVGDMLAQTEETLSQMNNVGKKSIKEILDKIEEYNNLKNEEFPSADSYSSDVSIDFDEWILSKEGKEFAKEYFAKIKIDALELISVKAYNLLLYNGYQYMDKVAFSSESELLLIPKMDVDSAREIVRACSNYLKECRTEILNAFTSSAVHNSDGAHKITLYEIINLPQYHDLVLKYVRYNDVDISKMGLSNRSYNSLLKHNFEKMSDIIFMSQSDMLRIPQIGTDSAEQVIHRINDYLAKHEERLVLYCIGDGSALISDDTVRDLILDKYREIGFNGLSLNELAELIDLSDSVSLDRLKSIIGRMLAANELEYVDYRCYRVYGSFLEYLDKCDQLDERSRNILNWRLEGKTLENIGAKLGITRERVRQINKKAVEKVCAYYYQKTGDTLFDEDYYSYLYETYAFEKKDAIEWFGMTTAIYNYLDMKDIPRGTRDLSKALDDKGMLETGLRLKIKNYLNRNKLYIDGIWIEKKRKEIEHAVIYKYCKEDVTFDEFVKLYNAFLEQERIEYDSKIYITEAVAPTRKNHLSNVRYLLWKQNEKIRYYDIDGRDFSELLNILNLDSYEDVELSTMKFMEDYPEIMKRYDIRNQYELHNLLRKIIPDGSYHNFHCSRTPDIVFGEPDRNREIFEIIQNNAPISVSELCDIIHKEYGYDRGTIQGTYLQPFSDYIHNGMVLADERSMNPDRMESLKTRLIDDFYYIDEIKDIYAELYPDAESEDINAINLKRMGFAVFSKYVLQNHQSLEAYFINLLTSDELIDLTPIKKRYWPVVSFNGILLELKKSYTIIEYERNQAINYRRLERQGITRDLIYNFCDAVYEHVNDNEYFSIHDIMQEGFASDLFDLGFSDWFYSNLLISDTRFTSGSVFGNLIFFKGQESITVRSFIKNLIQKYGKIDTYDLITELEERFGCKNVDRSDLTYKIKETEIFYDKILDRFYSNEDVYYSELDLMENV